MVTVGQYQSVAYEGLTDKFGHKKTGAPHWVARLILVIFVCQAARLGFVKNLCFGDGPEFTHLFANFFLGGNVRHISGHFAHHIFVAWL